MSIQSVKCKKCGTDNEPIYYFCGNCGTPLALPVTHIPVAPSEPTLQPAPPRTSTADDKLTTLPTVSARSFQGTIAFSQPKLALTDVQQSIQSWIGRQSFWPQELTINVLSRNLRLCYLAHWTINAVASGNWSATIGRDTKEKTKCPRCGGKSESPLRILFPENYSAHDYLVKECKTCDGRGYVEETVTNWYPKEGRVSVLLERIVLDNLAEGLTIRCGKRDVNAPTQSLTDADIQVFKPQTTNDTDGKVIANRQLQKRFQEQARQIAQREGNHYKDLQVRINSSNVNVQTWLYPIYAGEYVFNNETLRVQVDGITGEPYADAPSSVSTKRTMLVLGIVAAILAAITIIFLLANAATYTLNH